jgi:addiction module HigA family antidote
MTDWKDPIHPGEILAEELEEIGMKPLELAERIQVPNNRIYQIIDGKRSITADTATRRTTRASLTARIQRSCSPRDPEMSNPPASSSSSERTSTTPTPGASRP